MHSIELNRIQKIRLYIMTLFIIYITDSLVFATNNSSLMRSVNRIGVIIVAMIIVLKELVIKKKGVKIIIIALSLSIFASAFQAGRFLDAYSYYTLIACIWFSFYMSKVYSVEQFSRSFCNIMRIIAIVSLVCWVFDGFIKSAGFIPTITNTVNIHYKNLFLTVVPIGGRLSMRNHGPFWEPGAYQIYLNVAIFFTLYIEKKENKIFDVILFVFTCLTTLSGAALVPMILIIIGYSFDGKKIKNLLGGIIFLCVIQILFSTGIFDNITEKMQGKDNTNSMQYRMLEAESAVRSFINNPIFGSTPERIEQIKKEVSLNSYNGIAPSNTNTYLNYFSFYGLLVGLFFLLRTYRFFKDNTQSGVAAIMCFCAFIFSTSNENMMNSILIVFLMFIKNKHQLREEEEKDDRNNKTCIQQNY